MVTVLNMHVQIFASDIFIGSVIIMLCALRATFESAVYSVVKDIFGFDKNCLSLDRFFNYHDL